MPSWRSRSHLPMDALVMANFSGSIMEPGHRCCCFCTCRPRGHCPHTGLATCPSDPTWSSPWLLRSETYKSPVPGQTGSIGQSTLSLGELWSRGDRNLLINSFFFFFFFFLRAAPTAYRTSQARGQIVAVAAGLHHNHSNGRSKPLLQTTPQLMAMRDP